MRRFKDVVARLRSGWRLLELRALRCRIARCPLCGPGLMLRISDSELGVRCFRCGASAVHMSLASVIASEGVHLPQASVYELSARGPWVQYLKRRVRALTLSEYADASEQAPLEPGVLNENVERLSFANTCFDLVTCTDVFEHVADDAAGFAEVLRVLRPAGVFAFTVPLGADDAMTVERARRRSDGSIEHLLPPEYHGDRLRGSGRVLSFRDYAGDLPQRLLRAGFASAKVVRLPAQQWWGRARAVIVARKAERMK
jgi:SAM-dependent methyltransferase